MSRRHRRNTLLFNRNRSFSRRFDWWRIRFDTDTVFRERYIREQEKADWYSHISGGV